MANIKVKVLNQKGEAAGDMELNESVFGIEPNNQVIFDAVNLARANARQATAKTKKRDEVSGGGKKPYRQKGTGRARIGSTRAPHWRHGGIVFGPTGEQDYSLKMNKQERVLALKSMLSEKLKTKELIVVDKFSFAKPHTKDMVAALKAIKAEGKVLLVVGDESFDDNAILSAFNIPTVAITYCDNVGVYDLINCKTAVFTKEAVECVEEVLLNGSK